MRVPMGELRGAAGGVVGGDSGGREGAKGDGVEVWVGDVRGGQPQETDPIRLSTLVNTI